MESQTHDVLTCRFAVLSLAVVELARALPPSEATRARYAIRRQVLEQVCDGTLSSDAADAVARDLEPLLGALARR